MVDKIVLRLLALGVVIAIAAAASVAQGPVKRIPPTPVVVGSGNGTYSYKPGPTWQGDPQIIKLKVEGFFLGQVVVKINIGKQCGGSAAFMKENKSLFSAVNFIKPGDSAEFRANLGEFTRTITQNTFTFDIIVAVDLGGTRFMAPECSNSYSYTVQMENYYRYVVPKPYPGALGSSDYYDFRHRECIERHPGIGAPGYYKAFGEKYFNRFMTEVHPNLTPKGQEFITVVGRRLQQAIEDKIKSNPVEFAYLELNGLNFKNFAFKTHVDVYCNSGWGNLDSSDRNMIKSSVDKLDVIMDHYDRITFGKIWTGIITGLQVDACGRIRLPIKT